MNGGKLPADYLLPERVLLPKASVARNWVIRNIGWIQYQKNNFKLNEGQDKRISVYETYFVFVPLFLKPILTKQIILSMKNSQEFLAL